MRMTRAAIAALLMGAVASGAVCAAVSAQEINSGELVGRRDIPAVVREQVVCGTNPDLITRHPFGTGYLFAWDCPGTRGNTVQALIYADRRDGTGARLLRFSHFSDKSGADPTFEIANKRLFPLNGEIVESLLDLEAAGFCRSESRWKLIGELKRPMLVSVRQTRDCRGVTGWVSVLPKDATGDVPKSRTGDTTRNRTRW
jgi:hypothetical protein